jgi:hypothetical protein
VSQSSEIFAITLCVASQRVIPKVSVYFVMTQSGNFWIHPRISGQLQAPAVLHKAKECQVPTE